MPEHGYTYYKLTVSLIVIVCLTVRPEFFYFLFFSQRVSVGGRNKNKNKIHLDHFPIELKSKETRFRVVKT